MTRNYAKIGRLTVAAQHKSANSRENGTGACLAQAGQIDEARAALARLQEMPPENSIAWIEQHIPYTPGPMAKFVEGMRKAGLQ